MPADLHPVRLVLSKIIEDASIDVDQVRELEEFVRQDWVIDGDEVEFLFRVNQALGPDHDDCPQWTDFFVTSVCRLVVMDMNTPGQIDESEGNWLEKMFCQYSTGNESEEKLLLEIKKSTTSIAGNLAHRFLAN